MPPTRRRPRLPARRGPIAAGLAWALAAQIALVPAALGDDFVVFSQIDDPDAAPAGSLREAVENLNATPITSEENSIFFDLPNGQPVVLQDALDPITRNVELVADPFFVTSVREFDPDAETKFDILRVSRGTTILDEVVFSGGDFVVGIDPVEGADAVLGFRYGEGVVVEVEDDIHGLGGLSKEGLGDLFLSGINDFDGKLDILEGRVIVDEEGLPGDAEVHEGAVLRFDKFDTNLEGEDEFTPEFYAGTVTGEGIVRKAGPHDLTLDAGGAFEQTGGTEILEGRLITVPDRIPGDVAISRGAFLQLDVDGVPSSWAGVASGDGTLEKTGTGVLVLDGANQNRGGLDLQQGFVRAPAGNVPGAVSLAAGTRLFFDQANDGSYAGPIGGDGAVTKEQVGTLTLTGANDWTGGTSVDAGRLRGAPSAIPGDVAIAAAGSLEYVASGTATVPGQISGAGLLVKSGSGTLTLPTSQPGFVGATRVQAGTLTFQNDALLPGSLTVDAGARASGEGIVNGLTTVGGTLQPGSGLGTRFQAQGGALLLAGSALDVAVQYDGGAASESALEVSGSTTIDGGTVNVQVLPGDYATARSFRVLTSTDGITQNGALTTAPLYAFVDVDVAVVAGGGPGANPQDVQITVTQSGANAATYAVTTNQVQVAEALDEMLQPGNGTGDVDAVRRSLVSVTATEVPEVLDQMSAASLSDLLTQRLAAGHRFSLAISRRFTAARFEDSPPAPPRIAPKPVRVVPEREPDERGQTSETSETSDTGATSATGETDEIGEANETAESAPLPAVSLAPAMRDPAPSRGGIGLWFDAFGVFGRIDGGDETDDVKNRLYGGSVGLDYRSHPGQWLPEGQQIRLGAAFDYTRAAPFGADGTTESRADLYQVAGYVSWTRSVFYAGTAGRYGYSLGTSERRIDFGDIDQTASGDFDGQEGGLYTEAGARFDIGRRMVMQPWLAFEWARLTQSSFTETGASALDLAVDSLEIDSLRTFVGATWSAMYTVRQRYGIEPELRVGWAHEFGDTRRITGARLTGAIAGGRFQSIGAETTRNDVVLGAGYTMRTGEGVAIALDYDALIGPQQQIHGVTASLYVQW